MNNQKRLFLLILLFITIIFGIIYFVGAITHNSTISYSEWEQREFYFDSPQVITEEFLASKIKFQPLTESEVSILPYDRPIKWQDKDFITILSLFLTEEEIGDLNKWVIELLTYKNTCLRSDLGFSELSISLIRSVSNAYMTSQSQITISPTSGLIEYKERNGNGVEKMKNMVDINKMTISADTAFQLADSSGGYLKRQGEKDQCMIWVTTDIDQNLGKWNIQYTTEMYPKSIIEFIVDDASGEISILPSVP